MPDAQQPTRAFVEITVTRANGDVESHGIVDFTSQHPDEQERWHQLKHIEQRPVIRLTDVVKE